MKTHTIIATAAVAAGLLATGAFAQSSASQTASDQTQSSAVSPASPLPAPDSVVYVPRLPTPAELSQAAAAQSLSIQKIEQTSSRVTVVYKHADGSITTVAYELLATATSAAPAPAASTTRVVRSPSTTVIYASPSPWYYDYYDPFWNPWPWYGPPVSLNFGIGYRWYGGFHRGFDRDDFHRGFSHRSFGHGFRHR